MRDRTKQRNFDFAKYPEALEIIDNLPSHGRAGYIAKAVVNEHRKESEIINKIDKDIEDLKKDIERVKKEIEALQEFVTKEEVIEIIKEMMK